MRNTHSCPKCRSTDLLRIPGKKEAYGVGNNILVGALRRVCVTRYLCAGCGFSEEWIDDRADVEKLRTKYHE
jgi:predicted nucleic-acid-binding Zn-ribbon protein